MRRAVLTLAAILAACGPAPKPACPNDLPASCPSPAPAYQADVAPLLAAHCVKCHGPGGQQASYPLTTWDEVYALRGAVLDRVYACRMPPPGEPALTAAERQKLLGWLVCGAPND